jgi:hypothetical protein
MHNKGYDWAEDCPNCGQKDEYEQYKGARHGSTAWGHNYMCCSAKCGKEFLNSPTHKMLERSRIKREIQILESQLSSLKREVE